MTLSARRAPRNIASVLGQVGFRNSAAYVAAKHGVVGLSQNAALEYGQRKIRLNAAGPGVIKTPLVDRGYLAPERRRPGPAAHHHP